ncbi:MAG: DNA adenine methylase [Thermoleophilaceae bacterium]
MSALRLLAGPGVAELRTPLTYYGGKQKLARQIVPLMPAHRVYLEPFAGGAAVLFAKPRAERETLNDLDGRIVRFWRTIRDQPDELAAAVAATPYSRAEWAACRRGDDGDDGGDVEAARQLLVSIDQSFSRQGSWSPPSIAFDRRGRWQPGVWENLPPKLLAAVDRLRGVALECADALELIPRWDLDGAVIYCDPPYALSTRLEPEKVYAHDDDGTLWLRLVEVLTGIRHAAVILSGYPCQEAEALGWHMVPLRHKRHVQTHSGVVTAAPEVVWLSPAVPDRIPSLLDDEADAA